ncbi:MAG TPA: helix-turn-helix transcriptional regulator [Anseongella sp.]
MKSIQFCSTRAAVRHLRLTRLRRNYSQEFMAKRMGISQEAYSRLEINETTPSIDRLLQMADILEVPPKELLIST